MYEGTINSLLKAANRFKAGLKRPVRRPIRAGGLTVGNGGIKRYSSLIGPAAGHITDGVASSAQHQQWQVEALHVFHTLGVA